ncbi:hypothetical protein [Thalassospira lucentensis]|uniref:hypothetical protein n=1 Tax=Thalassospira lucentensis TaxID=168935 RepID=UPI002942BC43|nr:hypothetical protein [Thalassospira lucentensis]WOI09004.1 hypothetical protein R1T41_00825 [Thalassospira lucentensis]
MMGSKVVTICGSSRFIDVMAVCAWLIERDEQAIVMGLHLLPQWYPDVPAHHLAEAEGVAEQMDALHLEKIDRSDEIFVVNFDGYIGSSTLNEIAHAKARGIPVRMFSDDPIGALCRALGEKSVQLKAAQKVQADAPSFAFSVKDEENFHADLFEALEEAEIAPENGLEIEIMRGRRETFRASDFVRNIIPDMQEAASWDGGERADDWLDRLPVEQLLDLGKRVDAVVDAWADEYDNHPGFWNVDDVAWVKVRILDVAARTFEVLDQ